MLQQDAAGTTEEKHGPSSLRGALGLRILGRPNSKNITEKQRPVACNQSSDISAGFGSLCSFDCPSPAPFASVKGFLTYRRKLKLTLGRLLSSQRQECGYFCSTFAPLDPISTNGFTGFCQQSRNAPTFWGSLTEHPYKPFSQPWLSTILDISSSVISFIKEIQLTRSLTINYSFSALRKLTS